MNERNAFTAAALASELVASTVVFEALPANPLCAAFSDVASYVGQHTVEASVLWLLVFGGGLLLNGSRLLRARQNLSTKLRFLAWLGLIGIIIDNVVSLYQLDSSPYIGHGAVASAVLAGLAARTSAYVLTYSAVVYMSYMLGKKRKEIVTPPPRFGRE